MNKVNNIIKIVAVIIGTIIGAGFASGKEIYIFFAQYGKNGFIGAIISSILITIIIYCTILIVKKYKIENNNEFIEEISNNKITEILKNIINIFLVISFWIMCTGFCTFFKQEMGVPIIVTSIISAIITYMLLLKRGKGVIKLNLIVVPVMIAIILIVSIRNYPITNLIENNFETSAKSLTRAIIDAILYTSYNSITLIPIIVSINSKVENRKTNIYVSIISGVIICILILSIYQMLVLCPINMENIELPILEILNECKPIEKYIYCIAIVTAILTSAISAGYGILENIANQDQYKKIALIICLLEIPIAYIGFGKLVSILYPVFGVIGILQIINILKKRYNSQFKF